MPVPYGTTLYGQVRKDTLRLLDEYSSRGMVQSENKTADYNLKIQSLANDAVSDLSVTFAKIPEVFEIAHYPIKNSVFDDTSTPKQIIPGSGDFSISLKSAKACYFEAIGPGTAVIEEMLDGAVYTAIETIDIPVTVTAFTAYRRLIASSSEAHVVRLRFTGQYLFLVRNYVLYPISFYNEAAVQAHSDWVAYDLPDNFFKLNFIEARKPTRQYANYQNYRLRPDKKILFNTYDSPLNLILHFWRKPILLSYSGVLNIDDQLILDISDEAARLVPYFCAGKIFLTEGDETKGTLLVNIYESRKAALSLDIGVNSGSRSLYGW